MSEERSMYIHTMNKHIRSSTFLVRRTIQNLVSNILSQINVLLFFPQLFTLYIYHSVFKKKFSNNMFNRSFIRLLIFKEKTLFSEETICCSAQECVKYIFIHQSTAGRLHGICYFLYLFICCWG